jgi:hypothetical protein
MPDLETVDLTDVEILSTGGPVHGIGSPPSGDFFSADDLRSMATAAQELEAAGEWKAPAKIGHDPKQTLLSQGEMPAAGWLTNQRVSADGSKLLADIHGVPKKIADLVRARAYRTRSAELSKATSQRTGKSYPWVVSGMAFLGGKMPAVRTLDDIVAMYEGADTERLFVQVDEVDAGSIDELRDFVAGLGSNFLETRRHSPRMPDSSKFTDDQRRKFSEALAEHGVEVKAEDLTDEQLAKAGVAAETTEPPTPPTAPTPPPPTGPDAEKQLEQIRKFEERAEAAEKRAEKIERRLFEQARDADVEEWLRAGKAAPGQRDEIVAMYEEAPERTRKFFENAPVNEHFARAFGVDSDELTDEEAETANRSYEEDAAARLGIPKEAVL